MQLVRVGDCFENYNLVQRVEKGANASLGILMQTQGESILNSLFLDLIFKSFNKNKQTGQKFFDSTGKALYDQIPKDKNENFNNFLEEVCKQTEIQIADPNKNHLENVKAICTQFSKLREANSGDFYEFSEFLKFVGLDEDDRSYVTPEAEKNGALEDIALCYTEQSQKDQVISIIVSDSENVFELIRGEGEEPINFLALNQAIIYLIPETLELKNIARDDKSIKAVDFNSLEQFAYKYMTREYLESQGYVERKHCRYCYAFKPTAFLNKRICRKNCCLVCRNCRDSLIAKSQAIGQGICANHAFGDRFNTDTSTIIETEEEEDQTDLYDFNAPQPAEVPW